MLKWRVQSHRLAASTVRPMVEVGDGALEPRSRVGGQHIAQCARLLVMVLEKGRLSEAPVADTFSVL